MQRAKIFKSFVRSMRLGSVGRSISTSRLFVYGEEIEAAMKNGRAIVALESTIVTHGMPYPENFKTAIRVEDAVRRKGAVPATIAILNGQVHIGLSNEQLETLSRVDPEKTIKCSRRDISSIASRNLNGGTTVSATMLLANLAKIPIMATGGIGGIHRGAELTFDISTDLTELGRTPVAVVCSGVKSILDIGKTLEYLETQGVPVIKIGETSHFPAFYCRETYDKLDAPQRVSTSEEAADILKVQRELGLKTGILFALPIPEECALDPKEMEVAISEALKKAESMQVTGKNVTPFLLEKINKITCGESLQANIALIENNANVAAEIAVRLAEVPDVPIRHQIRESRLTPSRSPVVIGGAVMDTILQVKDTEIKRDGRTHAGKRRESCGGVGRNVANALINLGLDGTRLISVVGDDQPGEAIIKSLGDGARTVEQLPSVNTARYTGIVDSAGECYVDVGEMEEPFRSIGPDLIAKHQSLIEQASFVVLDGNLPPETMREVLAVASRSRIPVWYEPTDVKKATKVFEASSRWQNVLHVVSPNRNELSVITKYFGIFVGEDSLMQDVEAVKAVAEKLAEFVPIVVCTLGSQGVLVTRRASKDQPFYDAEGKLTITGPINSRLYPPLSHVPKDSRETFNVSGCGDCLAAGILYGIHRNLDEALCLSIALKAAALSLVSFNTVPDTLSMLRVSKTP